MKDQIKIILTAAGCGILIWIADTLLDYFIFYSNSGSFLKVLILSPPGHEIYIRILIFLVFILFGYFISENVKKQKLERDNFKRTLNSIGDAVISTDVEGKILRMNPVAEKLTGWDKKEAIGESIEEVFNIVNVDTREKVKNPVTKVLEQGKTVGLANHTVLISKNGEEYQISDSGAPIYDEDDNITGVVLVFRDVTEEYQLREKLKQNEQKYRTVFENTGTATIIIEEDTTISLANKEFTKLLGLSKEEIEGKISWTEFVAEEDLGRMKRYHRLRREKGKEAPNQYEFKMIDIEGERHNIFIVIDMIPGTKQTVASFLDITERKQMEEELKQSEQKYRRLVETTGDIIIVHDREGTITFANQSTLSFTKYTKEEILSKNIKQFIPEDEVESLLKRKQQREEQKDRFRFNYETAFLNKDGERIEVDIQATPLFENNEYKSSLIVARDITERKQAQKEKEELQEQLYQKQKLQSIGTLAGGIAHDFNNLLTVILGMSDLAMKRAENGKVKSNLEEVIDSGKKAADLADQLLLFSREKDTEFEIININKTIQALEKMLERLIGEDIAIHDEFEKELWKIRADEGQIEQIVTNMAINARDAMPEGGDLYLRTQNITIDQEQARTIPDVKPGSYVRLEIEDTGHGMDEETQDKIFDPFFTTKGRAEGTGMGLSVVHGIVKNHDGLINVYSEPEEGTVFRIYFPAVKQEESQQKSEQEEENLDKYRGQSETVLIVEDEHSVLKYIENVLSAYNYSYYSAKTAEEALDIWETKEAEFELLLSDMILPGRNGLELANELKEDKNSDLDVILSSGYSDNKISSQEVRKKGYRFVRKPFDIGDLLQSIYEAIHE